MNTDQLRKKVIVLNDFRSSREKKILWWRKIHPLQVFQALTGVVVVIVVVFGIVFIAKENWHDAAVAWILAFSCFFLFWALGYQARKDFDLYKTKD